MTDRPKTTFEMHQLIYVTQFAEPLNDDLPKNQSVTLTWSVRFCHIAQN